MKNLQKAGRRRIHKERAQPAHRARLGLLQKHGDYVKRARDYHRKQDHIKKLRQSAALRNPDEFYHAMIGVQTKRGIHKISRTVDESNRTSEALKKFTTQDIAYMSTIHTREDKKIDKMKSTMHLLDESNPEKSNHVIFVDSGREMKSFDAAEHFDTHPEFIERTHNRPRLSMLKDMPEIADLDEKTLLDNNRMRIRQYKELSARMNRQQRVEHELERLQLQKNLQGKGTRRKVKTTYNKFGDEDKDSVPVYKWKKQRKR